MKPGISCARTRNSHGRRKGQIGPVATAIREAVLDDLTARYDRMTVRQVYYRLEVAGVVEKTDRGYRQVQKQLHVMRQEGLLPWGFITDGTRWQRKPGTYDDAEDFIGRMVRSYRRDLWQSQNVRIEVWLEKDALADIVTDITDTWNVSLMVSRGQSSSTFLHSAAMAAEAAYEEQGHATVIYAMYDFDAGGDRAAKEVDEKLPQYAPDAPIVFERLAVTPAQINAWSLPTRPPKPKDPEAAKWGGKPCVELDAIDPKRLMALVENAITSHVDQHAWKIEQAVEQEEREGLLKLRHAFNGGGR